jgi:hypothetical protein
MDLYDHLVDRYEVDEYVLNDALLTPLTLAAHEGFHPFFQHIVARYATLFLSLYSAQVGTRCTCHSMTRYARLCHRRAHAPTHLLAYATR